MALETRTPAPEPARIPLAESPRLARTSSALKLLFLGSEAAPFAKTGGLGDVLGSLPRALADRGHECVIILPLYRSCRSAGPELLRTDLTVNARVGGRNVTGRLVRSQLPQSQVPVWLIEQPTYFERDDPSLGHGLYQYKRSTGQLADYPDNCERFVFFCRAALEALPRIGFWPNVVHCNDWQTALVPAYVREVYPKQDPAYSGLRTLYTIHNLAYQGVFWHWDMVLTGLDWSFYDWRHLEFYGHLNLMKGGIVFADMVSTVSSRYAQEIQTPEFGCGLESVLRYYRDKLVGIVNGVDYNEWNPATDQHIAMRYDASSVANGKAICKARLQERLGLPLEPHKPLLGMVTRLVEQKGLDLLVQAGASLLGEDLQLVILGTGDIAYQEALKKLEQRFATKAVVVVGFNESLAHQIEAGADIFLMPSRFEPSGLNQLYSLKYGTVPVVRNTGGLGDTVINCTPETLAAGTATGFSFKEYTAQSFLTAVRHALECFRDPAVWQQLQRTGMTQDWSWHQRAQQYEALYAQVALSRRKVSAS